MKIDNKKTGKLGEDLACEYLEKLGFLVIERNFSTRYGELDIVCLDKEILVFVEVKTKIGHDFGEPEEMVNKSKLTRVQRMGEVFIEMNNLSMSNSDQSNFSTRLPSLRLAQRGYLRQNLPAPALDCQKIIHRQKWNGGCRVDVVAVVLNRDLDLESIKHYEAVY